MRLFSWSASHFTRLERILSALASWTSTAAAASLATRTSARFHTAGAQQLSEASASMPRRCQHFTAIMSARSLTQPPPETFYRKSIKSNSWSCTKHHLLVPRRRQMYKTCIHAICALKTPNEQKSSHNLSFCDLNMLLSMITTIQNGRRWTINNQPYLQVVYMNNSWTIHTRNMFPSIFSCIVIPNVIYNYLAVVLSVNNWCSIVLPLLRRGGGGGKRRVRWLVGVQRQVERVSKGWRRRPIRGVGFEGAGPIGSTRDRRSLIRRGRKAGPALKAFRGASQRYNPRG